MDNDNKPATPKCPYCGKAIETPVPRKIMVEIIAIDFDQIRRKKYVGEKFINFCSADCGSYYQMGAEE